MKEQEALKIVLALIGDTILGYPIVSYTNFFNDDHEIFVFSNKDIFDMESVEGVIELHRGRFSQKNIMYYYILDKRK